MGPASPDARLAASAATSPSWLDRRAYPFASRYLQTPGGKLHYVDEGYGDPVVMVHGNPTWSFVYRHMITQLRLQHRCIALDHLGFGLSDKPAIWGYRPVEHASNLTCLIESLGLARITLVLHDWGGPIGLAYAVSHPDKVARIVLMNTWAWPVDRDLHFVAFSKFMGGPVGRYLIERYNFFAQTVLPFACANKAALDRGARSHYVRPLDRPYERQGCLALPKEILDSSDWLEQIWHRHRILRGKPKLLIWGMKDIAFREKELRRWQEAFPEAGVIRLPRVGHFPQEEAPEQVIQALRPFLAAASKEGTVPAP